MKRSRIIAIAAGVLALAGVVWAATGRGEDAAATYRFATIERGDIRSSVTATGTLSAVTTVQVGTQVSGQISAIYVDFNDRVRKGQLIARIDPTLSEQAVREAEAGLARARAELERARLEFERNLRLHEKKVVTDAELSNVRYQLQLAEAGLRSAQVAYDRAVRNLQYTEIYSPIDGIVVERNVDVGQTVAASLSAPQLFLIAQDLTEMQILASVDESDIGLIHEGQEVHFTVQAYPDETFAGTVKQVRLQSTTQENVVTYTVVVSVENPDGRLLPGMTATVEFVTGSAEDVLLVPNAALRFRPTPEMLAVAGLGNGPANGAPRGANPAAPPTGAAGSGPGARAGRPQNTAVLWYLKDGKLAATPVQTGITDGQRTVVYGPDIREGMQVIVGTTTGSAATSGTANPFQRQQPAGPPRPGGF
jgi:HlyD family secretion protein